MVRQGKFLMVIVLCFLFSTVMFGQGKPGDEYLLKGMVYASIGDNLEAIEMYEKAQMHYKNDGDLLGLGWVYLYKGDIYYFKGDYSTALEMYKEAFSIYERIGDII
jgi:tetratricopeptide (TPR) repeat protein